MEPIPIQEVAQAVGGRLAPEDASGEVRGVSVDSRQLRVGDLFVALRGPRFDGHAFLDRAIEAGAGAVLVEREVSGAPPLDVPVIRVPDGRRALGELASAYRRRLDLTVIAVAGSNGKTTTKNLLASVLSRRFRVGASPASYNNDIGVPLTLLELERDHEVAVLEVGTNHPGELAALLRLIRPDMGVLTGVGREHLEFFGDLEGVLEEEGWLAELLPADGRLVVNGDMPGLRHVMRRASARVATVGWGESNDWRGLVCQVDEAGTTFSALAPSPGFTGEYRTGLYGRHQVSNALLVLATADVLGLEPEMVRQGLSECRPAPGRLQLRRDGRFSVLDDSYNANADSMAAALQTLVGLPCRGRRVAVLGGMAELGERSRAEHELVGREAARSGVDQLVTIGAEARPIADAAREQGLEAVLEFPDVERAASELSELFGPDDIVLVKASRSERLERLVDRWREGGSSAREFPAEPATGGAGHTSTCCYT